MAEPNLVNWQDVIFEFMDGLQPDSFAEHGFNLASQLMGMLGGVILVTSILYGAIREFLKEEQNWNAFTRRVLVSGVIMASYFALWALLITAYNAIWDLMSTLGNPKIIFGIYGDTMDALEKMSQDQAWYEAIANAGQYPIKLVVTGVYFITFIGLISVYILARLLHSLTVVISMVWGVVVWPMRPVYDMSKGWFKLLGLMIMWPMIEFLMFAFLALLVSSGMEGFKLSFESGNYTANSGIMAVELVFSVINLIMITLMALAPVIAGKLITNGEIGTAFGAGMALASKTAMELAMAASGKLPGVEQAQQGAKGMADAPNKMTAGALSLGAAAASTVGSTAYNAATGKNPELSKDQKSAIGSARDAFSDKLNADKGSLSKQLGMTGKEANFSSDNSTKPTVSGGSPTSSVLSGQNTGKPSKSPNSLSSQLGYSPKQSANQSLGSSRSNREQDHEAAITPQESPLNPGDGNQSIGQTQRPEDGSAPQSALPGNNPDDNKNSKQASLGESGSEEALENEAFSKRNNKTPGVRSPSLAFQGDTANQGGGSQSIGQESIGQESIGQESIGQESIGQESIGQESIGLDAAGTPRDSNDDKPLSLNEEPIQETAGGQQNNNDDKPLTVGENQAQEVAESTESQQMPLEPQRTIVGVGSVGEAQEPDSTNSQHITPANSGSVEARRKNQAKRGAVINNLLKKKRSKK
ncbi:hypothetical protein [Shewanella algae]|uniref:hypothetical protein n=1 Tax=Shewanella algae TaxID=38313 RepID=UPI0031F5317C